MKTGNSVSFFFCFFFSLQSRWYVCRGEGGGKNSSAFFSRCAFVFMMSSLMGGGGIRRWTKKGVVGVVRVIFRFFFSPGLEKKRWKGKKKNVLRAK